MMDKEEVKNNFIIPQLKENEELIGYFYGSSSPSIIWFIVLGAITFGLIFTISLMGLSPSIFWYALPGALFSFGIKHYYIAVTSLGIHSNGYRFSMWGKPTIHTFYSWSDISKLKVGKGLITAPLSIFLSNGKKIFFKVPLKGLQRNAKLDDKTREFLVSKTV